MFFHNTIFKNSIIISFFCHLIFLFGFNFFNLNIKQNLKPINTKYLATIINQNNKKIKNSKQKSEDRGRKTEDRGQGNKNNVYLRSGDIITKSDMNRSLMPVRKLFHDKRRSIIKKIEEKDNIIKKKSRNYTNKTKKNTQEGHYNFNVNNINPENKKKFLSYFDKLKYIIMSNLEYPDIAEKKDIKGDVRIKFKLLSNGSLSYIVLDQASRYSLLNNNTINLIKQCGQFPRFPKEIEKDFLDFFVTVSYQLGK